MFPASVSSLCAISVALLVVEPLGSARAIEVPSSRSVDVRSFGATGDGKTDDTTTVQTAIDACKPGDILLFPKGRFLVKSVVLKAGVYYLGKEAVIARPAITSQGGTRTFTTSYASDEDSALTTLEGLTFDGNRKNQGPYTKYEQGQSHLVFLAADPPTRGGSVPSSKTASFGSAWRMVCRSTPTSMSRSRTAPPTTASEADSCSRAATRGAAVKGFTSGGTEHSVGFDIEVDGAGYGKTLRIELTMERLRLKDGHFDIAVGDGSKVEVRDAVSRSGFCLCAPNSTVKISDCDLGVGRFADAWNRIVFPGKTTFERCRFTLRPELDEPSPAPKKWTAIHIYWNISGTSYRDQRLEFTDCQFGVDDQVGRDDITYGIYAERDGPLNNSLSLRDCTFSDGFRRRSRCWAGLFEPQARRLYGRYNAKASIRCTSRGSARTRGPSSGASPMYW